MKHRDLVMRLRWEIKEERHPGERLPSIEELAKRFSTTRTTVSRALTVLQGEGVINVVHGKGTFITGAPPAATSCRAEVEEGLRAIAAERPGRPIPPVTELATAYATSQSTVRRAVTQLLQEGVLRRCEKGMTCAAR